MRWKTSFYKWLPWIVVGLLVIITPFLVEWAISGQISYLPWINAVSISTRISIELFSNSSPPVDSYWALRISALVGMLLMFVAGPVLWVFASRRVDSRDQKATGFQNRTITWYVGTFLTLNGLFMALFTVGIYLGSEYYPGSSLNQSMQSARNEDQLRTSLSKLATQAAEIYYLPHEMGGGAGSFLQIPDGNGTYRAIMLDDLKDGLRLQGGTFHLKQPVTDSTLTIIGVGRVAGTDPGFENSNGATGMQQEAVRVVPNRDGILEWRGMADQEN